MAKKKTPGGISVAGEDYQVVVLLINTKDPDGRPKLTTFIHDDNTISLAGGEEFITAYVPRHMLRKRRKPDA